MKKFFDKKIRITLIWRMAILFLVITVLSGFLVLLLSRRYIVQVILDESSNVAQTAIFGAIEIIWTKDPELRVFSDPDQAERVHSSFRDICQQTNLHYLYLYTVESDGTIRYAVCAAENDQDDEMLSRDYGFGATRKRNLYPQELVALSGDSACSYGFVNNEYGDVCQWVSPLLNRKGEVKGLVGADYDVSEIYRRAGGTILLFGVIVFFIILLIFLLSVQLVGHVVVAPLQNLRERMLYFSREKKVKPENRKTRFSDEITDIEASFNSMAGEIEEYIGHIEELTREKVQSQTQLDVARRIQCGIVPENTILKKETFDVYGFSRPARKVGGDFYDIFMTDEDHLFFMIGDVSGKGISSALFMMMVKSTLREKIKAGAAPDMALNEVNDDICSGNPECMFATVFAAVLDLDEGILTYANAGHNAPVVFGGSTGLLPVKPGLAIGIFEDSDIKGQSINLSDGGGILMYTDGFVEAISSSGEQFGEERLKEAVIRARADDTVKGSGDVARSVIARTEEFTDGREQFDDMTCICLTYHKKKRKRISLLPEIREFSKVKERLLKEFSYPEMAKKAVLACEEIFVNIVSYAGADEIQFEILQKGDDIEAVFTDNGVSFDPTARREDIPDFEELDNGGMGIELARTNSKEMQYKRDDDKNSLTLVFDNGGTHEY